VCIVCRVYCVQFVTHISICHSFLEFPKDTFTPFMCVSDMGITLRVSCELCVVCIACRVCRVSGVGCRVSLPNLKSYTTHHSSVPC